MKRLLNAWKEKAEKFFTRGKEVSETVEKQWEKDLEMSYEILEAFTEKFYALLSRGPGRADDYSDSQIDLNQLIPPEKARIKRQALQMIYEFLGTQSTLAPVNWHEVSGDSLVEKTKIEQVILKRRGTMHGEEEMIVQMITKSDWDKLSKEIDESIRKREKALAQLASEQDLAQGKEAVNKDSALPMAVDD